jgi:hypothetical protein
MGLDSFSINLKDGCYHLSGVLNEFATFDALKMASEPLRLNLSQLAKMNSIGIRNFLRFLSEWGSKEIYYEHATSEFIDQVNMIPSMKGAANQAKILSFNVPWQCLSCDHEDEVFMEAGKVEPLLEDGKELSRSCPKCGKEMSLLVDSYFDFLTT